MIRIEESASDEEGWAIFGVSHCGQSFYACGKGSVVAKMSTARYRHLAPGGRVLEVPNENDCKLRDEGELKRLIELGISSGEIKI
mgnify:CR=1 FL=1